MRKLRKSFAALLASISCVMLNISAFASGGLESSVAVTGTMKFLNDATGVLLIAAPVIGVICIMYFAIRHGAADEMDQKKWKQRIIVAAVSVLIAVLASALINTLTSYYGA